VGRRGPHISVVPGVVGDRAHSRGQAANPTARGTSDHHARIAPIVTLLLDTCTFLWLAGGRTTLPPAAERAIRDPANEVLLSAVSVWEIVVKHRAGKLPLPEPPEVLIPAERTLRGIEPLPFDEEAALYGTRLPPLHRDPFDRMLIAQAVAQGLAIVTPDPLITQYPVRVLW